MAAAAAAAALTLPIYIPNESKSCSSSLKKYAPRQPEVGQASPRAPSLLSLGSFGLRAEQLKLLLLLPPLSLSLSLFLSHYVQQLNVDHDVCVCF